MARIENIDDLVKHFKISQDCEMHIRQLYFTHKDRFLRPFLGICIGIKEQVKEITENEYEHPKGTFYVKAQTLKVVYIKESQEIINVVWLLNS